MLFRSCLTKTREDSFHNHLVAFPNFNLTESDNFQRARLILQEKPIGWLTLPIRCELDVGDLTGHHHFLVVVLLGMGEEFGDLQKAGCLSTQWYKAEGEQGEQKKEGASCSVTRKRRLNVGPSSHGVKVLYRTGSKVQSLKYTSCEGAVGKEALRAELPGSSELEVLSSECSFSASPSVLPANSEPRTQNFFVRRITIYRRAFRSHLLPSYC